MQRIDSDPIITNDLVAELEQLARHDKQAAIERFTQYISQTNLETKKPTERRLTRSHHIGKPSIDD
jgi:hypothetical protein